MEKIGVIINDIGPSQLSYFVIKSMNHVLMDKSSRKDAALFYRQYSHPYILPCFATMHITSMINFDGTIIATDLDGASIAINYGFEPIFYVNDLEWIRGNNDFLANNQIYRKAKRIIARSEEHKEAIANYTNLSDILVMPIFNIERILNET